MKINGQTPSKHVEVLVLPRGETSIVIKAQAVVSMEDFPLQPPVPPVITARDGTKVDDYQDEKYRAAMRKFANSRTHYLILESLKATEGLEWETVDMKEPETWGNYTKELAEAGFSDAEVSRIVRCVMQANALDDAKLEQARKDFLATQAVAAS
jgi:hypothetical protein